MHLLTMKLATCIAIFLVLVFPFGFVVSDELKPKTPAIYVFGDSTVDVGNNNYLPGNNAKANFPHYGIDFPHSRPTGRFSNGYNGADFLAKNIGFKRSPPPYLALNHKSIRNALKGQIGVNFASGGSGILDTTGTTITMTKQIQYFTELKEKISAKMGSYATDYLISKSIFLISAGGNDIFAFFSQNPSANITQVRQFYGLVTSTFETHLKALYSQGARKFGIVDAPPIGCCPILRLQTPNGACLEPANAITKGFNVAMKAMVRDLSPTLPRMKYSIGSTFTVILDIIANPLGAGFDDAKSACCGDGTLNAVLNCGPNTTFCSNRRKYVFWDSIHATHATSKKVAATIYDGSLKYATPVNFRQLVEAM